MSLARLPAIASLCLFTAIATAQKAVDVRLDLAAAAGASDSHEVQLASSGDFVYAVWLDDRSGASDVYCNRSLDGGATWLPQEVRIDSGTAAGATRSTEAQIAANGALVGVVWTEDNGIRPHVFFNRSQDGGATWLPAPLQLDVGGPAQSSAQMPTIACNSGFFYVAWSESRSGFDPDIYFNRSLDGGNSWLAATVRLDTGSAAGAIGGSFSPRIAAVVPHVYVVWDDFRTSNPGICLNHSADLGTTWQASDVALNSATSPNGPTSGLPQIAADGAAVYVCWTDGRFGGSDIFFQGSLDSGTTWLPADVRVDVGNQPGATRAGQAVIAAAGSSVHVAWRDGRNHANNGDVYYNHSLDGGATWGSNDQRLDVGSPVGATDSSMPVLAAAGDAVAVVWVDNRFGDYDIHANTSGDRGTTWLPIDVRVDTAPAGSDSARPALTSNGASFFAAWESLRNGQRADVYANLVAGYQPYGTGTAGTAAMVPLLHGAGAPVPGGAASLQLDHALAGAPGVLLLGLGPASRIALPMLGGVLLVNPATAEFLVLGSTGSASVMLPVPGITGLLGLDVNAQALVLDSGAVQGVSMSNAVALWIG